MSDFKYEITNFPNVDGKLLLKIEDEKYEPLTNLFFETSTELYPRIIDYAISGHGYSFEVAGINFPADVEEDGTILDESLVEIGFFEKTVTCKRLFFLQILLDMAKQTLLLKEKKPETSKIWLNQMEDGIKKLEEYIKNPDFKV